MAATERSERHPDDLPTAPRSGRGIPRGLLWALALAVVVLTIASWMALSSGSKSASTGGDSVAKLDNGIQDPSGGLRAADMMGKAAPDTKFAPFTGGSARIADLKGRPVVVNFWASTCTPCITEMPALEHLHQRYGDRVAFVGLAVSDPEVSAREMAARTGVTFLLGLDPAGDVARSFGAIGLPSTYLLDRDGVVAFQRVNGAINPDELVVAIEKLAP